MATIKYNIVSGAMPMIAELIPSILPINTHNAIGTYEFDNVPNGVYLLSITDSNGCQFQEEIIVDPYTTTTTTTSMPEDALIVGNAQDEMLIFNVNGTNRSSHYNGYPDPNISTLYLWFKTFDGSPITVGKLVNYNISSTSGSTFIFNGLSDNSHAEIIQNIAGVSSTINGQLYFKPGFIETYFQYTYNANDVTPDYIISLASSNNTFYDNLPLVDGVNAYGVTINTNTSVTMNF